MKTLLPSLGLLLILVGCGDDPNRCSLADNNAVIAQGNFALDSDCQPGGAIDRLVDPSLNFDGTPGDGNDEPQDNQDFRNLEFEE